MYLSSGPILESKGSILHECNFSKKGKNMLKRAKKGKIFENLGKNVKNVTIFCKRAGDCMQLDC